MALTRNADQTIVERVRSDPDFARALLDEAATLFLNGEPHAACLVLHDLVEAAIGFDALARELDRTSRSLRRMLSSDGNPSMDELAAIVGVVRRRLGVELAARSVAAAA